MKSKISVSGTVGLNIVESQLSIRGKVILLYDIHNNNNYCKINSTLKHYYIDEFLETLNMCSLILEEPYIKNMLLTPLFNTDHIQRIKKLCSKKSIKIYPVDIRLILLNSSIHILFERNNSQTLLDYILPILSIYSLTFDDNKIYEDIKELYNKGTASIIGDANTVNNNEHFTQNHRKNIRILIKAFKENISKIPTEIKNKIKKIYQELQKKLHNFIIKMKHNLDKNLYLLVRNIKYSDEREPLNKQYPFIEINTKDWLYELELIIDGTMELFTITKLFSEWKSCNVIYMGVVHTARISYWLTHIFSCKEISNYGTNEKTLPEYLDQITTSDSCVSITN